VHSVNPYTGTRPRITVAWNIDKDVIPGSPLPPAKDRYGGPLP
jgi:hypothetical protein